MQKVRLKFIYFDYNSKKMNTIEDRVKDCEKWEQAEEILKNFNEMTELIKKYPIKLIPMSPPPPYVPSDLISHCFKFA